MISLFSPSCDLKLLDSGDLLLMHVTIISAISLILNYMEQLCDCDTSFLRVSNRLQTWMSV